MKKHTYIIMRADAPVYWDGDGWTTARCAAETYEIDDLPSYVCTPGGGDEAHIEIYTTDDIRYYLDATDPDAYAVADPVMEMPRDDDDDDRR